MAQVHVIRDKVLREGNSQRRVAREMGISRNTVKKYMEVSEPKRVVVQPRRRPVLERVERRLGELVSEWSERTTRKQRLKGTRLHRELVEEGYEVGVTLVRSYLREWHRRRSEVYIPLGRSTWPSQMGQEGCRVWLCSPPPREVAGAPESVVLSETRVIALPLIRGGDVRRDQAARQPRLWCTRPRSGVRGEG